MVGGCALYLQEVWVTPIEDGWQIYDFVGVASPLEEVKVVVGRWVAPPLVEEWGVVVSKEEVKAVVGRRASPPLEAA